MSVFGKFGTGGPIPGKYKDGENETVLDLAEASYGTIENQPNSPKPDSKTDANDPSVANVKG